MFRPDRRRFAPGLTVAVIAAALALGAVPAGAAEGGENTKTHKLVGPAKRVVRCRICAGKQCTVVRVRDRCTKRRALAALEARLSRRPGRPQKALPQPQLDDRRYRQLEKKGRSRIPRHTPEWTDQKASDPGTTILETARRHPGSVRVQQLPSAAIPEPDDEVIVGFDQDDPK